MSENQQPTTGAANGQQPSFEHPDGESVLVLDDQQCWQLLHAAEHIRLGVSLGGRVDIVPVNIAWEGDRGFLRTAPGSKLFELTVNDQVALQADGIGPDEAWSVLAHGTARELQTEAERERVLALGLQTWVPTVKDRFVEIEVTEVTGRHFVFDKGADPQPVPGA